MVVQTLHRLSHSFDNPRLTRMAHYRGSSIEGIPACREGAGVKGEAAGGGTGHGLHFVQNVVEIHGGKVGCEPQKCGNLFYFILPVQNETVINKQV